MPHSIDFITADGGFDFSSDFNNQEELSIRLITCEICAALSLQKHGGTFVIKIFDMFTEYTLHLLNFLASHYTTLKIVKPLTSRPANSEKYLVCLGFKGIEKKDMHTLKSIVSSTWNTQGVTNDQLHVISQYPLQNNIIKNLVIFNTFHISRQVEYIQKTIEYIQQFTSEAEHGWIKKIIEQHIQKVKKWCINYHIPI